MIVIDEYLAVRLAAGGWPSALPDDEVVLPTSRRRGDLNTDSVRVERPVRAYWLVPLPHYFRPVRIIP